MFFGMIVGAVSIVLCGPLWPRLSQGRTVDAMSGTVGGGLGGLCALLIGSGEAGGAAEALGGLAGGGLGLLLVGIIAQSSAE